MPGRNAEQLAAVLRMIRVAGIRVSLGAIETGYASLAHMKRLPVDATIGASGFALNLRCDAGDLATIEAILGMARNLAIKVVADGIDTADETRLLRDRGSNLCLGFSFGKAVPAYQMQPLLVASVRSTGAAPGDDRADLATSGVGGM